MKKQFYTMLITYLVITSIGLVGYVKNITKLTKCNFKESYKAEVIRTTGIIVPPVGVIVGFLEIED